MFFERGSHIPSPLWLLGVFGLLLVTGINGKDASAKLDVPRHVSRHENVTMTCNHDLKSVNRVTWLHADQEVYRYSKDYEGSPKIIFPDSGVNVDIDSSSENTLVLLDVDLAASGEYTCTVVAEPPSLDKETKRATMTVVVIPNSKPLIEPPPGEGLRIGSEVDLNCTSPPSNPIAMLQWEVNGNEVPETQLKQYDGHKDEEGLFVSKLGLHFKLKKEHFIDSELNLKCTAKIATLYTEWDEHSHSQSPPHADKPSGETNTSNGDPHDLSPLHCIIIMALTFIR